MATKPSGGVVDRGYREPRERSAALHARANKILAGGVTHDGRIQRPFPIFVTRAAGARKWDVDGNEYVDYTMGHGALILGHAHPVSTQAAIEQLAKGTHYGACHELEVAWAEQIAAMVPSAERVRFHSSGTEATMMALRLARAATGHARVVKFHYHFHGWHDYATVGYDDPLEIPSSAGVPAAVAGTITAVPPELDRVRTELAKGDVAAVILEPSGASWGTLPLAPAFVRGLRALCSQYRTILIFDEVVTGFRMSPGGFQTLHGIAPDLTTLAKIVAGGLPGAALAGRADLMERFDLRTDPAWNRGQRIAHPGTFNANPLSAAAGTALLKFIADGRVHAACNATAERLRSELQATFDRHDVPGLVYGETSYWHLSLTGEPARLNKAGEAGAALVRALLAHGVHLMAGGGFVSHVHTADDIDRTVGALDASLADLAQDGLLPK
ncbi:MAG: aminotransferase class III-fold pyridoxal phosphate-dependent enzyme [Actinobacteria bacterium]|nr:aminotransferase class III-fold pyridoxal phosphate-dependent enzyme [Actinomycetota bacterium]